MSPSAAQLPALSGQSTQKNANPKAAPSTEGLTYGDITTIPQDDQVNTRPGQPPVVVPPTTTIITLLTINAQKAEANNPSLTGIVNMLDDHSPYILFLAETPLHTHRGL